LTQTQILDLKKVQQLKKKKNIVKKIERHKRKGTKRGSERRGSSHMCGKNYTEFALDFQDGSGGGGKVAAAAAAAVVVAAVVTAASLIIWTRWSVFTAIVVHIRRVNGSF